MSHAPSIPLSMAAISEIAPIEIGGMTTLLAESLLPHHSRRPYLADTAPPSSIPVHPLFLSQSSSNILQHLSKPTFRHYPLNFHHVPS